MITLYGGAIGVIVSVAVGWYQLDLPIPATHNQVQEVQQYAKGTREIVLNQEWFRLKTQLREAKAKLIGDPGNRELIKRVTRLELTLRSVEGQLDELRK